jgi:acetyl esterase/lipase
MILYAGGESRKLHRQAQCLAQALERAGIEQSVVVVPGESHARMVLTLSRPDKTSVPAILAFIRTHDRTHGE